ncbi:MAG TPA: phasin family protein [Noviherbaspirillum sp.]
MYSFQQQMTPAVQDYMNAQYAMLTDLSQRAFQSVQKINELNMEIARSAMEDSFKNAQQVMTAQDPYEAASIAASQAQPAAERLRGYQQELSTIAAKTQAELARAAEAHVPNASRTAAAVADDVARRVKEQSEQVRARQRSATERPATTGSSSASGSSGGATVVGSSKTVQAQSS